MECAWTCAQSERSPRLVCRRFVISFPRMNKQYMSVSALGTRKLDTKQALRMNMNTKVKYYCSINQQLSWAFVYKSRQIAIGQSMFQYVLFSVIDWLWFSSSLLFHWSTQLRCNKCVIEVNTKKNVRSITLIWIKFIWR